MLKKKDLLIIAVVLLAAVALFAGSKMLPRPTFPPRRRM